jgi:hypothetical protein
VTWIIRDSYINGDEFTMNGQRLRLEKVDTPSGEVDVAEKDSTQESKDKTRGNGRVIDIRRLNKT